MTAAPPASMRKLIDRLGYQYDERELSELIGLLAAAQENRLRSDKSTESTVTRSTALVVLNQVNEAVSEGMRAAGLRWEEFCAELGLTSSIAPLGVDDVNLHEDFEQALTDFSSSSDSQRPLSQRISLAIVKMARESDSGLVKGRLKEHGADLTSLPDELIKAFDAQLSNQPQSSAPDSDPLPKVWLLQYKDDDDSSPRFSAGDSRSEIEWRSTKEIKHIKANDPVIYWQQVNTTTGDRGGLVGTGRFLGGSRRDKERPEVKGSKPWVFYPTRIVEVFPDDILSRDEVVTETGLDMNLSLGSILEVPLDTASKIDRLLQSKGKIRLFEDPESKPEAEIVFIGDSPETYDDYLGRGDLAFVLAARLNRIWDEINKTADEHPVGGRPCADKSFVVHIDAPWGGGKTTFTNFLTHILNPYRHPGKPPDWLQTLPLHSPDLWPSEFRRAWHVVDFNAWQHQHINPPWWCFYQAIRSQCFRSVRTERFAATAVPTKLPSSKAPASAPLTPPQPSTEYGFRGWIRRHLSWMRLWGRELAWRIFSPKTRILILTFFLTLAAALVLQYFDLFEPGSVKTLLTTGPEATPSIPTILTTALVIIFGGATAIWSLFSALTDSLLPGTPDAAKNYSLGSGDPLERFRRHFDRFVRSLRRPVIVVVDDIDRCKPGFVVSLLQGMQTILRCPRVVFVLLGDRDWIEKAFANVHKAMVDIDVGPEHTFGGRFVEKSIQLSLVLPDITPNTRSEYVRYTLGATAVEETDEGRALAKEQRALESSLLEIAEISDGRKRDKEGAELRLKINQKPGLSSETQRAIGKQIDRQLALQSASDKKAHEATKLRLLPIADVLPSNPRQIKRIINGISLFQGIGRLVQGIQPESRDWCNLALWVVVMTEWPKTWATISKYPGIVDRARKPNCVTPGSLPKAKTEEAWLASIRSKQELMAILDFTHDDDPWSEAGLDTKAVMTLRGIMPAAGGELLKPPSDGPSQEFPTSAQRS